MVVNAAAWTAVDDAEEHEAEAARVNADGAANSGPGRAGRTAPGWCSSHRLRVRRYGAPTPYAEDAPLAPASAYGRTKAAGERAVRRRCPRTPGGADGLAVRRARRLLPEDDRPAGPRAGSGQVVDDQVGQPTWTADVAELIVRLVAAARRPGPTTRRRRGSAAGTASPEVVVAAGLESPTVLPTTSDAFVRPAPRPAYSVLGHEALHGRARPDRRVGGPLGGGGDQRAGARLSRLRVVRAGEP